MHRKTILSIMTVCALAFTGIDCSKGSTDKPVKDLGSVELLEGTPKQLNLAEGKEVTLTATALSDGNLQLVFKSESKTPDGISTKMEQKFAVPAGKKIMTSVNGAVISLTPTLKTK
jgi:hypothetical protein